MIKNKNRSNWFGASDTSYIMGNYDTYSFSKWWFEKLGIFDNNFKNKYTETGNAYEHKISKLVENKYKVKLKLDKQIKIKKLKLRVNFDASHKNFNVEIKTRNKIWKNAPKNYWQQVQVQMFADNKQKTILATYLVDEEYYNNWFLKLDKNRYEDYIIDYDKEWINKEYLPRLKYLCYCLKNKLVPNNKNLKSFKGE